MSCSWSPRRRRLVRKSATAPYQERLHERRWATGVNAARLPAPSFDEVCHPENLIAHFDYQSIKGQSPGPDGIRYSDFGRLERAEFLWIISSLLERGELNPGATRTVKRPKGNGKGHRNLKIAGIVDRSVASTVYTEICPVCEVLFDDSSYGFRPGRSTFQLLADLEATSGC